MKKIILIALCSICFLANAQNNYFYIAWDINEPLSSTDFIGSTSSNGMKAGFRFFPNDNEKFSLGVDVNWGAYDQYQPRTTMRTSDGHITTDYFKYIYTFAATASGQYYFKVGEGDTFFPYVGLGLGANHNRYMIYYNIYTEGDEVWGFLARPEAGMIVRVGRTVNVMAAAHYDYSTNKSEYFDLKNFSAVGFQLGIVFMNRR